MTTQETKLLDLFRACSDDQREIILSIAQIIHDSPPFDPEHSAADPASEPDADPDPEEEKVALCGKRLVQTAQKADIPYAYDMNLGELKYLYKLMKYEGDPYNALCFAFDYGFVKGHRATRCGKVKAI